MNYQQLTQEQRYQIYALRKASFNQTEIASEIGVHKATVSREVRRGCGGRGYRPTQAQALAAARLGRRARLRIEPETWQQVTNLLAQQWSPAQISGRLKLEGQPTVSHERIYQYIYADKRAGGVLHSTCARKNSAANAMAAMTGADNSRRAAPLMTVPPSLIVKSGVAIGRPTPSLADTTNKPSSAWLSASQSSCGSPRLCAIRRSWSDEP